MRLALLRTTGCCGAGIACVSNSAPPLGVTMVMLASLHRATSTGSDTKPSCSRNPAGVVRAFSVRNI